MPWVAPTAVDPPFNSRFVVANLRALWPSYQALRLDHLVLARVVLSADELDDYRTLPGIDLRVVRLEAPPDTIASRLKHRDPGVSQGFLLRIAPEIAAPSPPSTSRTSSSPTAPTAPSPKSRPRSSPTSPGPPRTSDPLTCRRLASTAHADLGEAT